MGEALFFWVDGRIEFILLGTEQVEGILIFLVGVVISLEGRDSTVASGAFKWLGVA